MNSFVAPAAAQKPPTIVLILCAETSSFNASFTLARGLKARGYRMLYTGPEYWHDFVTRQGFEYRIFEEPPFEAGEDSEPDNAVRRWLGARREMRFYRSVAAPLIKRSVELLKAENAVLLLIDPLLGAHSQLPLLTGIPAIALNTTLASTFSSRIPPAFSGLIASDTCDLSERLRNLRAWFGWLSKAWFRRFVFDKLIPLQLALLPRRSDVAEVKRLGGKIRWGEYGPCLAVPECVLAIPELDFPRSRTASPRVYAGSSVDLHRSEGEFDWGTIDPQQRLVYCSLGTYSAGFDDVKRIFAAVVEAVKQREDLQAIIQIGSAATPADFGSLPARIRVVDRVPQLRVLEHADVFITHGGFSSFREAASFGVPMIVFPYVNDGPGNAARVVYHEMGLRADYATIDAVQVAELLRQIGDERYRRGAARMQQAMRAQMDCQQGVDFVEAYLASHRDDRDGAQATRLRTVEA